MAPLENYPIMSGRFIQSFRHQNMATGDDFIYSSGIIFSVTFLATKGVLVILANDPIMSGRSIQLFRHLESQNLCIGKSYGRIVSQAEKQRQRFVHHMEKAGKEFLKRKTINPTI